MHTNFDKITLTIFAALGLPFGCAVGPGGIDTETETSGNPETTDNPGDGDGDTGDGDGDTGDGDGETGDGDGDGDPYACANPVPILQTGTDVPTGFVQCDDGFVHRVEAVECVNPQAADDPLCVEFGGGSCSTAGDCTDKLHGSCQNNMFEGCTCKYGCTTDADCDAGQICACAGVIGEQATCVPTDCRIDDDCGDGLCGLSKYEDCCGDEYKIACASPDAECHSNADCSEDLCDPGWPEGGSIMHQCSFDGAAWTCNPPGWCGCDCGRPFLVAGEARIAPATARHDWTLAVAPRMPADATRRALAAYWTEIGRFEHASIASFARFALQLLSLGAPPSLLADARAALADEIRHARLAFGLASAYAGEAVGPGALAIDRSIASAVDRRAIVEGLIVEACVGETLAAIEAQEAALQASDPTVARILQTIAADELRHAGLGWRALAWMLERADAALRRFAMQTLDAAIAAVERERPVDSRSSSLRQHGVLDDALRADVRAAGLARVIRPSVAALAQRFATSEHVLTA